MPLAYTRFSRYYLPMDLTEKLQNNLSRLSVPLSEQVLPLEPVRLLHGKGRGNSKFSHINIDYYPPLLLIALYDERSDDEITDVVNRCVSLFPQSPVMVQDRSVRPYNIRLKRGYIPEEMIIKERGLEYYLNPKRGQNPGFFTDMREGRKRVRKFIEDRPDKKELKILNLFAYTCSFSVIALAAGAGKVVNIDMNRKSLEAGKKNHRLNHDRISGGYSNQAIFLPHDIFKSFGRLKREGPYDLIIADPPPSQKNSFDLKRDYPKLLRRMSNMISFNGSLMLSLNSPAWVWEDFEIMVADNIPEGFSFERIDPPEDFAPGEPGRGLKLLWGRANS